MCRLCAVVPRSKKRENLRAIPQMLAGMMFENGRVSNKDGFGIGIPATGEFYKKMTSVGAGLPTVEGINWLWNHYVADQILVGHTRLSTTAKGKNEDQYAHPFVNGQWMLIHNGHIGNYTDLIKDLKLPAELEVDSEVALAALVSVWGKKATLTMDDFTKGLALLEGSYAFIIGNALEPDRLYLVVGSNPLNLYTNDKMYLVNTDSQLLGYIDQLSWLIGLSFQYWQAFTKTDLKSNHVYALDRVDGLSELGTFTPKVTVRPATTTWQGYTGRPAATPEQVSSPKLGTNMQPESGNTTSQVESHDVLDENEVNIVNPQQAVLQVARLRSFLDKNSLTVTQLEDMLLELPTVLPSVVWDLTEYDLNILQAWLDYLTGLKPPVFSPELMPVKSMLWAAFLDSLQPGETGYSVAMMLQPNFVVPFYLNSVTSLEHLRKPLELPAPKG